MSVPDSRTLPTTERAGQPPMLMPSAADALVPRSMPEAVRLAEVMASADVLPAHFRNKPGNCLAVIEQAMRWEMSPFAVAQKTFFVQGRMGYEAQLIAAVVHARAPLEGRLHIAWEGEKATRVCRVTGRFKGDPEPKVKLSPALGAITTKNSPLWAVDPDQQLAYWTIRAWARLFAPEVILGVYDREEMAEMHIGSENALDVTPRPPAGKLDALAATLPAGEPRTVGDILDGLPPVDYDDLDGGGPAPPPADAASASDPAQPPAGAPTKLPASRDEWTAWVKAAKAEIARADSARGLENLMRGWATSGHITELRHAAEKTYEKLVEYYTERLDDLRTASFGAGDRMLARAGARRAAGIGP